MWTFCCLRESKIMRERFRIVESNGVWVVKSYWTLILFHRRWLKHHQWKQSTILLSFYVEIELCLISEIQRNYWIGVKKNVILWAHMKQKRSFNEMITMLFLFKENVKVYYVRLTIRNNTTLHSYLVEGRRNVVSINLFSITWC